MINFPPFSSRGDQRCLQFETRKDTIVEHDELMTFQATAENALDRFAFPENNVFSLVIFDDDGKYIEEASIIINGFCDDT